MISDDLIWLNYALNVNFCAFLRILNRELVSLFHASVSLEHKRDADDDSREGLESLAGTLSFLDSNKTNESIDSCASINRNVRAAEIIQSPHRK